MTTFPEYPVYQPLVLGQRFPPIPTPPTGVEIVPFNAFISAGISVPVDETGDMIEPEEDYDEYDALGVATIVLPSHKKDHHSLVNRRKKVKIPNKDPSLRRASEWWVDWDETESLRKKNYNQRLPPAERLSIAAEDFREDRPWPPADTGIANFWDQFRMYIGLLAHPKNPNQKGGGDDDGDDPAAENMSEPVRDLQKRLEIKVTLGSKKKAKLRQPFDPDDPKTERFLDDPETNVKIFLSSYFSKKGLLWSKQRCVAFPVLLRFFLSYLIRCKTFSEKDIDASLRRAVKVAKRSEFELPKTGEIAQSLPNDVGRALVSLWGPRRAYSQEPDVQDPAIAQDVAAQELLHEETRRAVKEEKLRIEQAIALREQEDARVKKEETREREEEARLALKRASELQAQLTSSDAEVIEDGDLETDEHEEEEEYEGDGGEGDEVAAEGSWDDVEEGPQSGGESGAEPSPGAERDPWAIPIPTLISTLGPSALPLTHRTGVVERSTRRIKDIMLPAARRPCKKASDPSAEAVEEDLATHFARVVLEPWPLDHLSAHSQIEAPVVLPSSHGKVDLGAAPSPGIEGHAPLRDNITVLLDPKAVTMLENAIGMGLGATWTQIKRDEGATGKKSKGKSTSYWYMESLVHQIPSFWMDEVNESDEDDDDEDDYLN